MIGFSAHLWLPRQLLTLLNACQYEFQVSAHSRSVATSAHIWGGLAKWHVTGAVRIVHFLHVWFRIKPCSKIKQTTKLGLDAVVFFEGPAVGSLDNVAIEWSEQRDVSVAVVPHRSYTFQSFGELPCKVEDICKIGPFLLDCHWVAALVAGVYNAQLNLLDVRTAKMFYDARKWTGHWTKYHSTWQLS